MYIKYKKTAFVEIPKCASTSLSALISSLLVTHSVVRHATLQQYKDAYPDMLGGVALVREPTERLRSAIQFSVNENLQNISDSGLTETLSGLRTLSRPSIQDSIFYPQYSFLLGDAPLRLYPIQNAQLLLSHLGIDEAVQKLNRSGSSPVAESHIASLPDGYARDFYAIDFSLYRNVMLSSDGFIDLQNPREYFYSIR